MSDTSTQRMIRAYISQATPAMFLAGLFQSHPENFHSSEEVEVDVIRSEEDVSVVIQDLSVGYRMNSTDIYTNKRFKPPIHQEAIAISSFDLLKRVPGKTPFESPDFRSNLIIRIFEGTNKISRKIHRAIEEQASQILQTGKLTLKDENGAELFGLDYRPKASHFPTAGVTWDTATGEQMLSDLTALGEEIRNDGLEDPDQLIFGSDSFGKFIAADDIQALFDNRRINVGAITPMVKGGRGGTFRGTIDLGHYQYDIWTYGGRFTPADGSAKIQYVDPKKVIMRSSTGRLDATFGAIPDIGSLIGKGRSIRDLLPELPGRISNVDGGMDLNVSAWLSVDGKQLFAGVDSRPLLIPTAIDTYGCLEAIL